MDTDFVTQTIWPKLVSDFEEFHPKHKAQVTSSLIFIEIQKYKRRHTNLQ